MRYILVLIGLIWSLAAHTQCDTLGVLIELQATTRMSGLLYGNGNCILAASVGGGLSFSGGTIANTAQDQIITITPGGIVTVGGTYPNFTISASEVDGSVTNELQTLSLVGQNLTISGGNTVTLPSGVTSIAGIRGITVSNTGGAYTVGLPTASNTQTMYYNGTNWVANSQIIQDGSSSAIGTSILAGFELNVGGAARFAGSGIFAGSGDPLTTFNSSSVTLLNTTSDTWRMSALDNGNFEIYGDGSLTAMRITPLGQLQALYSLRIGAVTGTPTSIIGRNASGDVGAITIGSGLTLSAGTLSASGGGGTVTGANNLLTLSGSNVQFGGTATQNNTANRAGFYVSWTNGKTAYNRYNSNTFINANVTTGFDVAGLAFNPQFVASPTEDAVATFRGTTANAASYLANALFVGVYPTTANGVWLQSRSESSYTTSYPLVLQPLGGKLAVNRSGTPPPAYATINGGGIAGTGASGEVLMIENPEGGNGYAEIGFATTNTTTASNTYNAGVGYTSGDNAQRLYNLSVASGASVRFGVGGRTSDKVVITGDNTIGRLGAGFSTTTGLHSTLQSSGSLAVAVTETTGALTLNENHQTVIFTGSANQTFTLPTASTCVGRVYRIGHAGTGGTVTLSASVTSGSGTFTTVTAGQWATIVATSTGWKGFKIASL